MEVKRTRMKKSSSRFRVGPNIELMKADRLTNTTLPASGRLRTRSISRTQVIDRVYAVTNPELFEDGGADLTG